MKAVFFHWSHNLFENFNMKLTGSDNGSGLWAMPDPQLSITNDTRVDYTFTVDNPNILNIARPFKEEDHNKLLDAARKAGNTDLITKMEKAGPGNFTPEGDSFTNSYKDILLAAGFDAVYGRALCFLSMEKVGDFHVREIKGEHAKKLETYLDTLDQNYPNATEMLATRADDGEFSADFQQNQKQIFEQLDQVKNITPEQSDHLKNRFAGFALDQVDNGGFEDINATRLFLYTMDKVIDGAMHHQGTLIETGPYMSNALQPVAPPDGSISAIKDTIRDHLSPIIQETDHLHRTKPKADLEARQSPAALAAAAVSGFVQNIAAKPESAASAPAAAPAPAPQDPTPSIIPAITWDNMLPDKMYSGSGRHETSGKIIFPDTADAQLMSAIEELTASIDAFHTEQLSTVYKNMPPEQAADMVLDRSENVRRVLCRTMMDMACQNTESQKEGAKHLATCLEVDPAVRGDERMKAALSQVIENMSRHVKPEAATFLSPKQTASHDPAPIAKAPARNAPPKFS